LLSILSLLISRRLSPTLFPYTTLFRSHSGCGDIRGARSPRAADRLGSANRTRLWSFAARTRHCGWIEGSDLADELGRQCRDRARSEEHTSELQSPYDLVCRLLLEKKKK